MLPAGIGTYITHRPNGGNESRDICERQAPYLRADLRDGKAGIIKLAAAHGVGVGTVQRIKAALAPQS